MSQFAYLFGFTAPDRIVSDERAAKMALRGAMDELYFPAIRQPPSVADFGRWSYEENQALSAFDSPSAAVFFDSVPLVRGPFFPKDPGEGRNRPGVEAERVVVQLEVARHP